MTLTTNCAMTCGNKCQFVPLLWQSLTVLTIPHFQLLREANLMLWFLYNGKETIKLVNHFSVYAKDDEEGAMESG